MAFKQHQFDQQRQSFKDQLETIANDVASDHPVTPK